MGTRLSEWLKARMQERNMGRNELARATGLAPTTLTRLLRHGQTPRPEILVILADYFGADRDTVLEMAGLVQLSDLPSEIPPEVRDLTRRLYRLPPRQRDAILRQMDGILRLVEEAVQQG